MYVCRRGNSSAARVDDNKLESFSPNFFLVNNDILSYKVVTKSCMHSGSSLFRAVTKR